MKQERNQISRVTRSKAAAKASYDRMSKFYDLMAGSSEGKFVNRGLDLLHARQGEKILDLGFGTGKSVLSSALSVGETGRIFGLDISEGMLRKATERLAKANLLERVDLRCGDALKLPFEDRFFDGVFSSFTVELFDTPEIPKVLQESYRVLRPGGRIVVVSLAKKPMDNFAVRLYEWAHAKLPHYVDCRPIYLTESLAETGFQIGEKREFRMWGLPVDIVLAFKSA